MQYESESEKKMDVATTTDISDWLPVFRIINLSNN